MVGEEGVRRCEHWVGMAREITCGRRGAGGTGPGGCPRWRVGRRETKTNAFAMAETSFESGLEATSDVDAGATKGDGECVVSLGTGCAWHDGATIERKERAEQGSDWWR